MPFQSIFMALVAGLAGAFIFSLIHAPMPWLLGPLFAVLLIQLVTPLKLTWPPVFRNAGLVAAGYVIGFAFTLEALQGMQQYFFVMLLINCAFFLLFLGISRLMEKRVQVDRATALTCCVPGGVSQILVFAEEQKGIDLTAVTFYHVLRVLLIVAIVPFIVAGGGIESAGATEHAGYSLYLALLLVAGFFTGMLFTKFRVPTAYLLGPVFFVMVLNVAEVPVPVMPESLLHFAQLLIGVYIGLLLKKENLKVTKKLVFYAFFSSIVLIVAALGISVLLQHYYGLSFATSFLSTVPGGLDQMGIIAASVQADVTVVTAFQLFRILFLSVLIVPFVKWTAERNRLLPGGETGT